MRLTKFLQKVLTLSAAVSIVASSCLAADCKEPTTGMEFVLIKGGKFMMGDIYGKDKLAKPTHSVTVDDFYIGVYEVTFDQYDKFCTETKRDKPDD